MGLRNISKWNGDVRHLNLSRRQRTRRRRRSQGKRDEFMPGLL